MCVGLYVGLFVCLSVPEHKGHNSRLNTSVHCAGSVSEYRGPDVRL